MIILAQISVRVFHVAPTLLAMSVAVALLFISAKRMKSRGLAVFAYGLLVLLLGISALQGFYFQMEYHWIASETSMRVLYGGAIWLPTAAAFLMLFGAWLLFRKSKNEA